MSSGAMKRLRRAYLKFRGLPEHTPEEVRARIQEGLKAGTLKFEYDHPMAAECFPQGFGPFEEDLKKTNREFTYLKVEVLKPYRPPFWKSKQFHRAHDGGIFFQWGMQGVGFGDASIVSRDGAWSYDAEMLGPQFLKDALAAWVDSMEIPEEDQK
jgi:hypothetical protein